MNKIKKNDVLDIEIPTKTAIDNALVKMTMLKNLRVQFWRGEITLEELNIQLRQHNINKQYAHADAV